MQSPELTLRIIVADSLDNNGLPGEVITQMVSSKASAILAEQCMLTLADARSSLPAYLHNCQTLSC